MLPSFSSERRRKINLGGSQSTASHASILNQVKHERTERQDVRRRQESAMKLQAWWRSTKESRRVKEQMRSAFDQGTGGVDWTRYLVLGWGGGSEADELRLARWSRTMVDGGNVALFDPFTGPQRERWLVLVRQVSLLLLKSVTASPQPATASNHLVVLESLLSASVFRQALPENGAALCADINSYIVARGLYSSLSQVFASIPIENKSAPSIPHLVNISVSPFSALHNPSPLYTVALTDFTTCILTLPLLPNRLPITSLRNFSRSFPFSTFGSISVDQILQSTSLESKLHLVANICAFFHPHIEKLSPAVLRTYLTLQGALLKEFPPGSFELVRDSSVSIASSSTWVDHDSDSDSEPETVVIRVANFVQHVTPSPPIRPSLDSKTALRLQSLVSHQHISSLVQATARKDQETTRPLFFALIFNLGFIWPSQRDKITSSVLMATSGSIVKELWREWVRRSPLGKSEDAKSVMDPTYADSWPPLLLLVNLYVRLLLTMGDDEFFSTASSSNVNAPRNPLSLDDLTTFSRQLFNIAFALYWHDDQVSIKEGVVPGLQIKWEGVRDSATKCLQAIHARDSRKPFMPEDQWLVTSQIDMLSFIEAAVVEERDLGHSTLSARSLSKRQAAYLSPRLGVLNNIPFAIPFEIRVAIFRRFVQNDQEKLGLFDYRSGRKHHAVVHRGQVAKDGFDQLNDLGPALKGRLDITFIDQWGQREAGIDGGGVFKEFLTSLTKEIFDTDRGLWLATTRQELYPNPHSYAKEQHQLNWFRFIGRILGKALYSGILLDVAFAPFFLAKWLGKQSFLDDLASLDQELYQGLIFLKHYAGNPEDLSLNFTIAHNEFGAANTIDLVPDGSQIPVTRENRLKYIYMVSRYRLTTQIKPQSEAFFEGLSEIIDPNWLRMFNQQELQILIGGVDQSIDIDDLRSNTVYGGLYSDTHEVISNFWKVVKSLDHDQRRKLIRFATSCSRPPLLGFKELNPRFCIRDAGLDENRLPTASTCVNLLKLPMYGNEYTMKQKLLQAINSNAGFDLS